MGKKQFTVKPLMFTQEQRNAIFKYGSDESLSLREVAKILNTLCEENKWLKEYRKEQVKLYLELRDEYSEFRRSYFQERPLNINKIHKGFEITEQFTSDGWNIFDGEHRLGMIHASTLLNNFNKENQLLKQQLVKMEYRYTEYRNKLKSLPKDEVKNVLQKYYNQELGLFTYEILENISNELGIDIK